MGSKTVVMIFGVFIVLGVSVIGLEYFFRYQVAKECERIAVYSLETAVKETIIPPDNIKIFDRATASAKFFEYLKLNADLNDGLEANAIRPKILSAVIDEFSLYDSTNVVFPFPHGEDIFHDPFGHLSIRFVIRSLLNEYTITLHLDVAAEELD